MFFIFPVPLWFVVVWIAGGLMFVIWGMFEDADIRAEERLKYKRFPGGALADMQKAIDAALISGSADLDGLLKRLAATR